MTKKEMFANIATLLADNEEVVEFCNREIQMLENRKSSKKGLTATQKANIEVKAHIVDVLTEAGEGLTVTEILKDERMAGFSNQKISALLRQLMADGLVDKVIEGKKALFSIKAIEIDIAEDPIE